MSSIRVNCSCGKQLVADVPTDETGFAVMCPTCGASVRIKPPWVSRDQFKKTVVPAAVDQLADHMKKKGYYKIWSSSLDGSSCSLCAKLEGTAVKINEPFKVAGHSVMEPPLHDGCRCAVLYEKDPESQLRRDYDTFLSFARIANDSDIFDSVVNSYFSAIFFLQRLVSSSPAELKAAGLSVDNGASLYNQMINIQNHQDQIFNSAIKRAYDREQAQAQSLKTERGRKVRMDRLIQDIIGTQALSQANYEYLRELSEGR